ncbi:MAG: thiol-activated cytolysin family protein [Polyangiaceae bacterium]
MLKVARSLPFLFAAMFAAACTPSSDLPGDETGGEEVSEGHQAIDQFVNSIDDLVLPDPMNKSEVECQDASCPKDGQEGDEWCVYKHYAETVHYDKFVAFQPNSATLWPGVVVKGQDAQEGLLTPVGVKLAPVTFSVSLENIANSPVGHMEEPSLSAFRDERNAILAGGVTGATPASLDFDIIEVNSQSQIAVALGAGINWPGGPEIAGSFDFSSSNKKTKILVNFTQAYYTIDIDAPTTPKDFFDPSVTVDDLKPFAGPENPPLYVQSITFGRRVLFSIESNESASSVKAALEATYKGAVDVNAKVSTEHQNTLAASTIQAFVLGGAGGEATGAVSGFEGLINYIKNGGNYSNESPGAPIAYKLAYLDNTATKLAFTTEYSERECEKNVGSMRGELVSIKHVGGDDVGSNIEFSGLVGFVYPTVKNGNVTCEAGGVGAQIWYLADGQWISMPEYSTWTPSAPTYVDVQDVAFGKGKAICLIADMWEEDTSTNELSADDWYGTTKQLILYENGWEGQHTLHMTGEGTNAVDVTIKLTLK